MTITFTEFVQAICEREPLMADPDVRMRRSNRSFTAEHPRGFGYSYEMGASKPWFYWSRRSSGVNGTSLEEAIAEEARLYDEYMTEIELRQSREADRRWA